MIFSVALAAVLSFEPPPTASEPVADIPVESPADARPIDDAAPTSVPAIETDEVPADGAAIVEGPEPEPVAPPRPAVGPKVAVEPEPEPERQPRKWPSSKRRGVLLLAGVGAGGCPQDQCDALKAVPWFSFTGGYRFGRFAPILTVQGGAGPAKSPKLLEAGDTVYMLDSARDTRTFLNIGVGTLLHLLMKTPFDPYFGVTIGYLRTTQHTTAKGYSTDAPTTGAKFDFRENVHRGNLGIILGVAFRIGQHFTIGPRVDVLVPFGGQACVRQFDSGSTCTKFKDLESVDPGQYFPRPWAATLQIGAVI